jgi:excisionase family DNA binding protein
MSNPAHIPLDQREAMSIVEAASVCGLGRSTIYKLMEAGRLRSFRIGGRRLIRRADLMAFLEAMAGGQ